MPRCCSESNRNRKISKCEILSCSHLRKLHVCTLFFLFLVFGSKIREIDHIVIPSEVVCLRPYPPQFLKNGHVPPHPFHTMIQKSKTIILCSICTIQTLNWNWLLHKSVFTLQKLALWSLFWGGKGGCWVCHVHFSQLRGPRWRLDGFCVSPLPSQPAIRWFFWPQIGRDSTWRRRA